VPSESDSWPFFTTCWLWQWGQSMMLKQFHYSYSTHRRLADQCQQEWSPWLTDKTPETLVLS